MIFLSLVVNGLTVAGIKLFIECIVSATKTVLCEDSLRESKVLWPSDWSIKLRI